MSGPLYPTKFRPFSADKHHFNKVRPQLSNCPSIVKHEIYSTIDTSQPLKSNRSQTKINVNTPGTSTSAYRLSMSFLPETAVASKSSRSFLGEGNSTINFDFINEIRRKNSKENFKDKSNIKAIKKLQTDRFHNVIFRVRHDKDQLEEDITRVNKLHKDVTENELWNAPQSTIVDNILKTYAKADPSGNISKFVEAERKRADAGKKIRRSHRPMSSKPSVKNARSVKDFFGDRRDEEDEEDTIKEILSARSRSDKNSTGKREALTNKLNNLVESIDHYYVTSTSPRKAYGSPKDQRKFERGLKDDKDFFAYSSTLLEQGESISEIVEKYENSNKSPSLRAEGDFADVELGSIDTGSNGEISMRGTAGDDSPLTKLFSGKKSGKAVFVQEAPSAIHYIRPHTGKIVKQSASAMLQNEERKLSVERVQLVPQISMEGQKISTSSYNQARNRLKELSTVDKEAVLLDKRGVVRPGFKIKRSESAKNMKASLNDSNIQNISGISAIKKTEGCEVKTPMEPIKAAQQRLMSARSNRRADDNIQRQFQESVALKNVKIDGAYFENYFENMKIPRQGTTPIKLRPKSGIKEHWSLKGDQSYFHLNSARQYC